MHPDVSTRCFDASPRGFDSPPRVLNRPGNQLREIVMRFARHGVRLLCRIVQSAGRFRSKQQLL